MPRPSQCGSCYMFESCMNPGSRGCAEDIENQEIARRRRHQTPGLHREPVDPKGNPVSISSIEHTRGKVSLAREGSGPNTTWKFQVVDADGPQAFTITSPQTIVDLKAVIGQVEQAAKVLNLDPEEDSVRSR